MKNLAVYDENDYEMVQLQYEEMSSGTVKNVRTYRDAGVDVYAVDYLETCEDLCGAGFVIINGRVHRRNDE